MNEEREIVISEAAAVAPIEQVTQITKQSEPPLELGRVLDLRIHESQMYTA